jgi:hypothetical protein
MPIITVLFHEITKWLEGYNLVGVKYIIFTETQPHAQIKL